MKKLLVSTLAAMALLTVSLPVLATGDEPIYNLKYHLTRTYTLSNATATTINGPIITLKRGENVSVQFDMAAFSTPQLSNVTAYFRVSNDGLKWSPTLVAASGALNGTTNVAPIVTLTNGVNFPASVAKMQLNYVTNSGTVNAYLTNISTGIYNSNPR